MKTRSEARFLLFSFVMYVKNQFNHNVKIIRLIIVKNLIMMNYVKTWYLHQRTCVRLHNKILLWKESTKIF